MPGDVLLAPQRMGQVAVVHVRGSTKYALVRDAFLAKTDKVTMKLGLNGVQGSKDVVSCREDRQRGAAHLNSCFF